MLLSSIWDVYIWSNFILFQFLQRPLKPSGRPYTKLDLNPSVTHTADNIWAAIDAHRQSHTHAILCVWVCLCLCGMYTQSFSFFFLMISLSEGGRRIDGDSARVDCFIEKIWYIYLIEFRGNEHLNWWKATQMHFLNLLILHWFYLFELNDDNLIIKNR